MNEPRANTMSRRLALQLAAGSLALPGVAVAAGSVGGDFADSRALLAAYRRMRYSAGPGVTFWWLRATKYGLVDGCVTPLFGMEIGNFSRVRATGPEGFAATSLEMVFFTDLATGERVESIVNPYTGERLPRPNSLVGPTTIDYTLAGPKYPAALPGVKFDVKPAIAMFAVEGDDVWLRDDNSTTVMAADSGAVQFVVNDLATYHCRRDALADAALLSVPGDVSFNSVSGWPRWLKMAERPGSTLSRGSGRKFMRFEDMPGRFTGLLRERYPDLARDPVAALDRPPFSFAP